MTIRVKKNDYFSKYTINVIYIFFFIPLKAILVILERRCINRITFILNTYNEIQSLVEYRFLIGNILKMLPQMPK